MASGRERVVREFCALDPRGTGAVPRAAFEDVLREVCGDSPARWESLGLAVPGVGRDEVRYEEFFGWVYGCGADASDQEEATATATSTSPLAAKSEGVADDVPSTEAVQAALAVEPTAAEAAPLAVGPAAKWARPFEEVRDDFKSLPAEAQAEVLAELRRLTPRQSEAARRAAAGAAEVAAAASEVPDAEKPDGTSCSLRDCGSNWIMELLDHTPLLDLSYVIELVEAGGVIPRNQEVPPAALITPDNAWRLWFWEILFMLPVLVLSYPWLDWWHPDRNGEQLQGLLPIMKILLAEARKYSPHATIGLMMDYPCLPQKPFATEGELGRFKASLGAINAWYFHPCTTVLVVSTLPPDLAGYTNTRPHSQRGWCFFEKAASEAVKYVNMLWDLRGFDVATCTHLGETATLFKHSSDSLLGQLRRGRGPPVSPEALADALRSGVADGTVGFTATADLEIVTEQYWLGFVGTHERAYSSPGVVDITGLGWDDASFRIALRSLIYLSKHCAFEGDKQSSYLDYGFREGSDGIQREFVEAGKAMRQDNPKLLRWIYSADRVLVDPKF